MPSDPAASPAETSGAASSRLPAAYPAIRQRFFRLAGLNLLANITVPLTGLIDTAMLGHLAEIRFLAGVALGAVIFETIYFTLNFLRMATTGTTALAVGADDTGEVYRCLYRALVIALGFGAVLIALQLPAQELGFSLLRSTPGVEAAGREYFSARIWGSPAALANLAFLGWFLGRGESGRVLALSITGNLVNIGFNWLFILQLGWAARGAGWATVLSQVASLALGLAFFYRSGAPVSWRWEAIFQKERFRMLLALNRDLLIRSVLLSVAMAAFLGVSARFGTVLLAASSILQRLFYVASYLIDGVAFAVESLVGVLRSRGQHREMTRLCRLALVCGVVAAVAYLALVVLARRPILGLLTSHPPVSEAVIAYLPWLALLLPLGGLAFVYDGIYLGLATGRPLRNSMLLSIGLAFLPGVVLAITFDSLHLLWAGWIGLLLARVLSLGWVDAKSLHAAFPPARPIGAEQAGAG